MTRPVSLDFGAVMSIGAGAGVDLRMLAELMPAIEAAIICPEQVEVGEEDDDGDT